MSQDVVLRLSRLPNYFQEKELREYLEQFGRVKAINFPKSRKTLRGRGYAFVKISGDIAPLVSSTIDNVLNFNKIMKCEVISNPNWKTFKRRRLHTKSTQITEQARQSLSALKRQVKQMGTRDSPNQTPKPLTNASRRRVRTVNKRIAKLEQTNPNFKFQLAPKTNKR